MSSPANPSRPAASPGPNPHAGTSVLEGVFEATLANGLKVILKEAHHAPIACVSVWYRAGSKHESAGTTGLAHLLEHMMFKGTARHGKGEFDRILKENGASNNASTWLDRTNYYEIIAADRVEIALELEADRMRGALFTQQDLVDEMPVVRNELERGEDNPHRRLFRHVQSTAFIAHPYRWPTIGWRSDVEAITAEDIRAYYDSYYHPNNAFLVVVGDFQTQALMETIERCFGGIPAGPATPRLRTVEPPQKGERRFQLKDVGGTPYMLAAFRAPQASHEDVYALDVLAQILGHGRASRLYESLVQTGLATSCSAFNMARDTADPYLFFLDAEVAPGQDNAVVEAAVWAQVQRIKDAEPTEAELKRALKQNRVDFIYTRDRVASLTFAIGESEITMGYRTLDSYLEKVGQVTPEQIRDCARRYLIEDTRTVGWYIPEEGTGGGDVADDEEGEAARAPQSWDAARKGVCFHSGDGREPRSAALVSPSRDLPVVHRRVLPSGLTVLVQENSLNQTVEVRGAVHAGGFHEATPGAASMVARMLDRGTERHTAPEIAEILESEGASVDFSAGRETLRFSGRSITDDHPLVMRMLGDMLVRPSFPEAELELVRASLLNDVRRAMDSTYVRAALAAYAEIYGAASPYAHLLEGREETVRAITRASLVDFHRGFITPNRSVLVVVGDVEAEETFQRVEEALAGAHRGPDADPTTLDAPFAGPQVRSVVRKWVEMPEKNQVDIVMARRGIGRNHPDYYAAFVANFILGGDFTSRLNKELRDNQGLTYGTNSRFSAGFAAGPWSASIGVNPGNVERAIDGMHGLIEGFVRDGATSAELDTAIRYLTGSYPVRLETNGAIASQLLEAELFGLGSEFVRDYPRILEALTLDDVNAAARAHLGADGYVLVCSGTPARSGA